MYLVTLSLFKRGKINAYQSPVELFLNCSATIRVNNFELYLVPCIYLSHDPHIKTTARQIRDTIIIQTWYLSCQHQTRRTWTPAPTAKLPLRSTVVLPQAKRKNMLKLQYVRPFASTSDFSRQSIALVFIFQLWDMLLRGNDAHLCTAEDLKALWVSYQGPSWRTEALSLESSRTPCISGAGRGKSSRVYSAA